MFAQILNVSLSLYLTRFSQNTNTSFLTPLVLLHEKFSVISTLPRNLVKLIPVNFPTFLIKQVKDAFSFQLTQLINQLEFIELQVKMLDEQITIYTERTNSFITTIPGIGAVITSELFSEAKKVVAYAWSRCYG